jgi:hypothetical protein
MRGTYPARPSKARMTIRKCDSEKHLFESGLQLAVYTLVGRVTSGGKNPLSANYSSFAIYLYDECTESKVNTIKQVFTALRKKGFLELRDGEIWYVSHDAWAAANPGKCADADFWTNHRDALFDKLTAFFNGELKLNFGMLRAARGVASDEEFMAAIASVPRDGQSPTAIFWRVVKRLQRQRPEAVTSPAGEDVTSGEGEAVTSP